MWFFVTININMKKISIAIFACVLSILSTPVFAQSTYQMYVSNILIDKEMYSVGEMVSGQFNLYNMSDTSQSDIYYVVEVGSYDLETLELSNLRGQSEKNGPLYVKGKAQINIPFEYRLPQSISGQSALQITAYLKDGTLVGKSEYPVTIIGETTQANIQMLNQNLHISDFDENIEPEIGPTIYEGETISFNYGISADKDVAVTPVLRLYDRVDNSEQLIDTIYNPSITIGTEVAAYTIDLPVDLEPLVYYGVLSFEDEENEVLYSTTFRYIISGPIATVRNITTDVLEVKKGKTIPFVLSYGTQPFDELRPDKQFQNSELMVKVQILNENGEEIGNTESKLDATQSEISLSIKVNESAENISFRSQIVTSDGKVLDEYQTELPTSESVANQRSMATQDVLTRIFLYVGVLALVLVGILSYIAWRKNHSFKIPVVIFLFGVFAATGILSVDYVRAGITADGQEYLDSVELDLLEGWKIYQSYKTIYDKKDAVTFGNFQVTSVSSPLPPKLKIYEPGEKFKLTVDAVYGDCNNESRKYWAFAYRPDIKWWNQTPPKGPATDGISERLSYWQNAKLTTKIIDWNGGDSWKELFLITDLAPILDSVSVKKAVPLREIVKILGIQIDKDDCYKSGCFTSGISAKLYGFDEFPNDEDAADYVNWARNNKARAENVKNIIANYKKGGNDPVPPALANFDFTDTSKLKINTKCEDVWWGKAGFKEVCTRSAGNSETTVYINRLKSLKSENKSFTNGPLNEFYLWFTKGEHTTELTPVVANKAYTAPTVPGFHKMYFYLFQNGNSGSRDITVVQTICVRGAGVCPNENKPLTVSCAAGTGPVQAGITATFTSAVENNVGKTTYSWKINGKEVKTTPTYPIAKIQKGTYKPTLTVTDSLGRTKTANCTQLVVQDPLTVSCSIAGNNVTSVTTGKITGNPLLYSWKVDNTSIKAISSNITIKSTDSKANVTVKDSKTGAVASGACNRGSVLAMSCSASPDPVSLGRNTNFTPVIQAGTAPFTYEWIAANGQKIGDTKILKRSWAVPGTKDVTFKVTDGLGKSDSQTCSVEVVSTSVPVDGVCSVVEDQCEEGDFEPVGDSPTESQWICKGIDGGVDSEVCTAPPSTALSVSCVASNVVFPDTSGEAVATAKNNVGTVGYQWQDENGNDIGGANTRTYTDTYVTPGSYRLHIQVTDDNNVTTGTCYVTARCNTDYSEGEVGECIGGFEDVWSCTRDGWKATRRTCVPPPVVVSAEPLVSKFIFDPDTIPVDTEKCGLTLNASSVSSCRLVSSTQSISIPLIGTSIDLSKSRIVPPGRYSLSCTGVGAAPVTKNFGTQSCIINPDFRER